MPIRLNYRSAYRVPRANPIRGSDARSVPYRLPHFPSRISQAEHQGIRNPPAAGEDHNHRCAGEWITIDLTEAALRNLVERMEYYLPQQDLSIKLRRIPAIPESRVIIDRVRKQDEALTPAS
ncbi:hypothetical protein [Neolewinella xylanilytica]|uniref:hypothetical protein n=1 Tax=Neolewinella xylanilytica TaxID=1514080 RepID=UPI000CEB26C4|nr:hypothetical protein [Neolewinella xylanilytica]